MANENGKPTAAEKEKGKATDGKVNHGGEKANGAKAGADGKLTNGKKGDEPQEGMGSLTDLCLAKLMRTARQRS